MGVNNLFIMCAFITQFCTFFLCLHVPALEFIYFFFSFFSVVADAWNVNICCIICWHDFRAKNLFMRRQNENWNVLCIKAQFQMDYCVRSKNFMPFHHTLTHSLPSAAYPYIFGIVRITFEFSIVFHRFSHEGGGDVSMGSLFSMCGIWMDIEMSKFNELCLLWSR